MTKAILRLPKFHQEKIVEFIGGLGTIKNYCPESGSWAYLVEMEMKLEPKIDKISYETMILLSEVEIFALKNNYSQNSSC